MWPYRTIRSLEIQELDDIQYFTHTNEDRYNKVMAKYLIPLSVVASQDIKLPFVLYEQDGAKAALKQTI